MPSYCWIERLISITMLAMGLKNFDFPNNPILADDTTISSSLLAGLGGETFAA